MTRRSDPSRRDVLKAAVAVGSAAGLSACLGVDDEPIPAGVEDPTALPERQHAWNETLDTDDDGNHVLPRHHAFLYVNLRTDEPTAADRETVESALAALDRAYERSPAGLLYSIAYSPAYFERYGTAPEGVDLPPPRRLSDFEQPTLDTQDVLLHLASDRPRALLEAEAALFDERETANGVETTPIDRVFELDDRRSGFIGAGMPADRADEVRGAPDGAIPDAAKLFMGFDAGFAGNQATEEYVTIADGPFAGGTTKHVSKLSQRLDRWYDDHDHEDMVLRLFGTRHLGAVEGVGTNLGSDSGVVPESLDELVSEANAHGAIGHAQKIARANRDEAGNVRTLRRHVESTDDGVASLHFPSLQRDISTFEAVREAMNGADIARDSATVAQRDNNGILRYIFTQNRGNFLVPPRSLRALPTPTGSA
ncbi:MAG: twin-arginine translocation signal domain-containing protein [Natronomonas sp.]